MSALGETVGNFRSLGAAAARLVADLLDGPEPCVHDLSEDVEWSRGWDRGWRSAEEAYGVGPCQKEGTRRAEGTQHAQTPGEVSDGQSPDPSPSPGDLDLPDSALYDYLADLVDRHSRRYLGDSYTDSVVAIVRDRSAQSAALESIDTP
ncbi:hypothetical protein [Mycobacterium sp. 48b]|uniref:hypothetical protein n=1 Tax=Mycobacterium sp. 48b TaxID=3400426 RepID=UPI003AAAF329